MAEIRVPRETASDLANRWFQPLTHVSARGFPRETGTYVNRGTRETRRSKRFAVAHEAAHSVRGAFPALLTPDELERAFGHLDTGPMGFRRPPKDHIVYFVGGETGPVKIGFTQQPIKARLVCIQNGSPVKLHVLATVNCTRINERFYHKRFAAYRLHGEWFERCPEIEAEIARLTR